MLFIDQNKVYYTVLCAIVRSVYTTRWTCFYNKYSARGLSTLCERSLTWCGERTETHFWCIVYGTASDTNLQQLDSIQSSVLRLVLGVFCTSPVFSLYTEANEAPLEEHHLKLSMYYYVRTCACTDDPAHHGLHEFAENTRDLCVSRPNGRGGMTRSPTCTIVLKVETAMASAEIKVELVCLLITLSFPPEMHDYDRMRHNFIEGVSK